MAAIQIAQAGQVPPIVLIVDDDASTLQAYARCLEASGVWVATAHPSEAVATACEVQPDLVITDSYDADPDRGGLLGQLKRETAARDVPIILLSGTALSGVPLATRQAADVCLEKPVLPDVLLDAARTLLRRSASRRQQQEAAAAPGDAAPTGAPRSATIDPARSVTIDARPSANDPASSARLCPGCASALEWIERARLYGAEYDYYHWCNNGCGLYCYDRTNRAWVKLA
jgi:CheY-like chemotaxis protein